MKKKLLISWGSPYHFQGQIIPLIPNLAEHFLIYVMFNDYHTPISLRNLLESMRGKKLIEDYWLFPDFSDSFRFSDLLKHHRYICRYLSVWKGLDFDILLASDDFATPQRYLNQCVISEKCLHVCWIPARTHLLINEGTMNMLLGNGVSPLKKDSPNWLVKVYRKKSFITVFKKGVQYISSGLRKAKKKYINFLDRIVFPFAFVGKVFRYGPYDAWTQTGSGECDAMIFCDEVVAKVHAPFCKASAIYMASYSAEGCCRCNGAEKGKSAILVLVGHGYEFRRNCLSLYERDIRTVLAATGAKTVHLRSHPRATGDASSRLSGYLKSCGIDVIPVDNTRPVFEIVCDYLAVVGPLSDSLRDARIACDYIHVACFIAVSDPRYANPRFSFGDSQFIGWIEKDGSYAPDLFVRRKFERKKRKTVVEILTDLS